MLVLNGGWWWSALDGEGGLGFRYEGMRGVVRIHVAGDSLPIRSHAVGPDRYTCSALHAATRHAMRMPACSHICGSLPAFMNAMSLPAFLHDL